MPPRAKLLKTFFLPRFVEAISSGQRTLFAIILALVVSAGLILLAGANPFQAYGALLDGSIGSLAALANTGVRASPLLLTGLCVAIGLKAGLLNAGTEGYMYIGGIASTVIGLLPLPIPAWLHLTLALLAGVLGGAIWGILPGYLRAYRGVSEVVITLMLNYVAIYLASWVVHEPSPLAERGAFFPQSPLILPGARMPILIQGTSLHYGFFIGILLCLLAHFILQFTPFGLRSRMIGGNIEAARYAGVETRRQIMSVIMLGAGLGGMAGGIEVLGLRHRLFDFFVSGVGYEGLSVALLANASPIGVIFAACFFAALKAGSTKMQTVTGIEAPMALVIQGLCVLFVIGVGFVKKRRLEKNILDQDAGSADKKGQSYGTESSLSQ